MKFENLTRLEVIDETGRILVKWNLLAVVPSLQDDGRTLKLFISSPKGE